MRTTLTIDDDVCNALWAVARARGCSFKEVVNTTLRKGLMTGDGPQARGKPFRVDARRRGFLPGIDPLRLNQLLDEMDIDAFLAGRHDDRRG